MAMANSAQETIQISDDEVFRRKLLMDGDGMGDERRLTHLLRSFLNWCDNKHESEEQIILGYEGLVTSLENCELLMSKSYQAQLANKREIQNYEELECQIKKKIALMQDTILKKKEELKEAKKIREQKQKYDALAKIIVKLPDRKETEIKLKALNEEIKGLGESKKQLESKLETRHKELGVLLSAAATLKETIKEEESSTMME
ncbi:THO complex subunit 7 homolog [Trichonephila inaurata madagascariensis]|uniref:THO complex subunit 7 homolog n=1 Tax=Trichonephila inaurata madagascariensis TaxID=2747483 RepID=A0A8X7CLL3_9ARAC|nr:THO complex subunit 7 homolog [Trichonephila inaurata madagascariensis]